MACRRKLSSIGSRINHCFTRNLIKRPEILMLSAVPTNLVSESTDGNAISPSVFADFDVAWTSLDAVGLCSFVIGALVVTGSKVQEMSSRNRLVSRGFYAHSRNPMAMGSMLSLFGGALLTHNLVFATAFPALGFVVLHFYAIPLEEKECIEKFGEEYKQYMQRTGRWITFPNTKLPNKLE